MRRRGCELTVVICLDVAAGLGSISVEGIEVGADVLERREVLFGGWKSISERQWEESWALGEAAYLYHCCTTFENPITWLNRTARHIGRSPVGS